jgi:hypothetical protein
MEVPAALPPGKSLPLPIGEEAVWDPEPVWTLWRREDSCPCRDSNPGRPAHIAYTHTHIYIYIYISSDCVINLTVTLFMFTLSTISGNKQVDVGVMFWTIIPEVPALSLQSYMLFCLRPDLSSERAPGIDKTEKVNQ